MKATRSFHFAGFWLATQLLYSFLILSVSAYLMNKTFLYPKDTSDWRTWVMLIILSYLIVWSISRIIFSTSLYIKYKDGFLTIDSSGVIVFDQLIPWYAINSVAAEVGRLRIFVADPTLVDAWRLTKRLYVHYGNKPATRDVYIPKSAFELPLDEVASIIRSFQPHGDQKIERLHQRAVSKGRLIRRKESLILFATIGVIIGAYIIYLYSRGQSPTPAQFIVLAVVIFMAFEIWRMPKE